MYVCNCSNLFVALLLLKAAKFINFEVVFIKDADMFQSMPALLCAYPNGECIDLSF